MKVFVLAAGYATRLYPLSRNRAKPLLEVGGEAILTHIVRRVSALEDVTRITVIVNRRFLADFRAWRSSVVCPTPLCLLDDGSTDDEDRPGALGDLAFGLGRVPLDGEDWMVVAGDNLIAFDLAPLQRAFLSCRQPMLLVREVDHAGQPTRYNEVTLDSRGRVLRFREKPPDPRSGLAAIALYFFPPEVAELLERYLEEGGERDAPGHFVAWLVDRTPVSASRFEGGWFDIGSRESLERARSLFSRVSAP